MSPTVVRPEHRDQQDAARASSHKRILCFDSSSAVQSQTCKVTESATPERERKTKPNILGGNKPKRRIEPVRCSADPQARVGSQKERASSQTQENDLAKKNSRKQVHSIHYKELHSASSDRVPPPESEKKTESGDRLHRPEASKAKDQRSFRSSESALKTGSRKDKEESSRKEDADEALFKSHEQRLEKRPPSQEGPSVTANKENEMKGILQEQRSVPSASGDFSPPAVPQLLSHTPTKTTKVLSKTSALAKQAAEMLQNIQGLNSPVKKAGAGSADLSPAESPRTLSRQNRGKDVEGTSKPLAPPNTQDMPTCSPASEAGSENSIDMAAHTLMILSRAAIARTGTPLKDSTRQEGVGEKSPTSSRISNKRKQSSPTGSPPAKRESRRSPSKKKDRVSSTRVHEM